MKFDIDIGGERMLVLGAADLADTYNRIQDRCLQIANDFARIMADAMSGRADKFDMCAEIGGKRYRLRERYAYSQEFRSIEDISSQEFTCSFEYNAECSCHPRYEKFTQSFPTSLLCIDDDDKCERELTVMAEKLREQWDKEHHRI